MPTPWPEGHGMAFHCVAEPWLNEVRFRSSASREFDAVNGYPVIRRSNLTCESVRFCPWNCRASNHSYAVTVNPTTPVAENCILRPLTFEKRASVSPAHPSKYAPQQG